MEQGFFTLTRKAFLALALLFLPIVITFVHGYYENKALLKEHVRKDLTILADAYEGQVYQFIESAKRRTADFSSDGFIRDAVDSAGKKGSHNEVLSDYLIKNKLPLDRHVHAIIIAGTDGKVLASTDRAFAGKSLKDEEFFKKGSSGVFATDQKAWITGPVEFVVAAPLTSRSKGSNTGVLVNLIRLSELDGLLTGEFYRELGALSSGRSSSRSFEAYIVNRDRVMLTSSRFIEDAALKTSVDTPPVRACLAEGREVSDFYDDYRGTSVAGASMCIPSLKWTLLVEIDESEVMEPVAGIRKGALLTLSVVGGLIAVFFFLFYSTIIMQLRKLLAAAGEMARGRYDVRIHPGTKDEIGALSNAFNEMASGINARNSALKESEDRLNKAQAVARLGSWDWNIVKNTLHWSDGIYHIFGLKPQEFGATYESFLHSVHPDDRDFVKRSVEDALLYAKPYSIDHRIVLPDGKIRIVHEEGDVTFEGNRPVRMVGTVQDVTEQKTAEFELKKLSMTIEQSVNIVFITNQKGTIEYVNPMFEKVTGYNREEAIGQTPRILASGEVPQGVYEDLWNTILSGKTWRSVVKNKKKTGGYYWASAVISPIRNDRGETTHFLAIQEDITEKMASEERLKHLAQYDELTGLINRTHFLELLDKWISEHAGEGASGTLFLLDIDQFKLLNDTYGHGVGDEFLMRIARIVKDSVEKACAISCGNTCQYIILGRLSGDEFAIFFPGDLKAGMDLMEEIRTGVAEFRFSEAGTSLTVSIGASVYPEHGRETKDLFTKADAAVYRAKELGRNRIHVYHPEDHDLEKMHTRLAWRERILSALKASRFEPWLQPILDLKDNEVHHYEVLARMVEEDGTVLLPGAFIDIAERFGLIGQIDRMMTEKAMRIQAALKRQGKNYSFAMNLSGKDLGDDELLSFLRAKIEETGADPSCLVFEITETAAIGELSKAVQFIKALKELGCHFALDDFGVGFTSFKYLQDMQVDYIKIDGSFIRRLHENKNDRVFVKALTDVARGLNIKSIAEFVEKDESLKLLREFGVDYAQGYLIGKPAPLFPEARRLFDGPKVPSPGPDL